VTDTVVALVLAQVLATVFVGSLGVAAVRRFPRARREALGDERRDIVRFVLGSSLGTGLVSLRGWLAPVLLGVASDVRNVGLFRAAQAPQQGFGAWTSPVRLILLTEQTRDWERGRAETVYAGVRRYALGAAVVMSAAVPLFWWLMPDLVRTVLGREYTGAVDAARIILIAAAVQVVFGWTKSFPVSIGRPSLRVVAHGAELAVLVPLLIVLGREWGATGAAGAVLAATIAFALVWTAIIVKLRGEAVPQVSTA
jgi:O-antigen/teichoic acid export membrane protein